MARINGLEYAWVYRNDYFQNEIETLSCYIEATDGSNALVILDDELAAAERLAKRHRVLVLDGLASRNDAIINRLLSSGEQLDSLWLVVFPVDRSDLSLLAEDLLAKTADYFTAASVHGVHAINYHWPEDVQRYMRTPRYPLAATFDGGIRFAGYAIDPTSFDSDRTIRLRLFWQCTAPIDTDYTVFTPRAGCIWRDRGPE